ncbi:MAG: hypothetical protein ABFD54_14100 [Armatimonadota bacterium]|nr:serine protease [bacterium]
MFKKTRAVVIAAMCSAALLWSTGCWADSAEEGRKIADAHKDAVVTVALVLEGKISYQGNTEKQEHKVTTVATIIDPSGLAVASLSEIDPTASAPMDQMEGFSMTIDVIDAKLKMADGTEIPADIVLRDRDLDLAFIKPKQALAAPAAYVDLTQPSNPQLLDELVTLSRLGPVANRALAAEIDRVEAVITKPRTMYVICGIQGVGAPAFTIDGKAVGVVVNKSNKSDSRDDDSMSSRYSDSIYVVMPCSTIIKAAAQAAEAPAEKTAEAAK